MGQNQKTGKLFQAKKQMKNRPRTSNNTSSNGEIIKIRYASRVTPFGLNLDNGQVGFVSYMPSRPRKSAVSLPAGSRSQSKLVKFAEPTNWFTDMGSLFSECKWDKLKITWVPNAGSLSSGTITMGQLVDVSDVCPAATSEPGSNNLWGNQVDAIENLQNSTSFKITNRNSLTIKTSGLWSKIDSDVALVSGISGKFFEADKSAIQYFRDGIAVVAMNGFATVGSNPSQKISDAGYFRIEGSIQFRGRNSAAQITVPPPTSFAGKIVDKIGNFITKPLRILTESNESHDEHEQVGTLIDIEPMEVANTPPEISNAKYAYPVDYFDSNGADTPAKDDVSDYWSMVRARQIREREEKAERIKYQPPESIEIKQFLRPMQSDWYSLSYDLESGKVSRDSTSNNAYNPFVEIHGHDVAGAGAPDSFGVRLDLCKMAFGHRGLLFVRGAEILTGKSHGLSFNPIGDSGSYIVEEEESECELVIVPIDRDSFELRIRPE
jgi:hypothetical protein